MRHFFGLQWVRLLLLTFIVLVVMSFAHSLEAGLIGTGALFVFGSVYTEANYLSDVILKEEDSLASRDAVTVLSGQNLKIGTVLGKITKSTPTTGTADGGNTGDGTCTGVLAGTLTKIGTYILKCIGTVLGAITTPTTGTADGGNTGNGTCTGVSAGSSVKAGTYTLTCTAADTNAGTFEVKSPTGETLPPATVGVAYTNAQINFTLNDGSADFIVGDKFTILASAADGDAGTFEVKSPTGETLPPATVGVAYTNPQINFTLNDGAADFIAGDIFTIEVAAGSGKVKILTPAAVDGSQNAYGILTSAIDASAADVDGAAVVRDAVAKDAGLVWPDGITAGEKAAALAELEAKHITVREAV